MEEAEEDRLYALAEMNLGSAATGEAVIRRDFDEARFRAHLVAEKAKDECLPNVLAVARCVHALLPARIQLPPVGIGMVLMALSDALRDAGP